jgi:hypothetical protein
MVMRVAAMDDGNKKPPEGGFPRSAGRNRQYGSSALARLETRVGLADHEDLTAAADDLAVAVTGLRRLQGGQDLHELKPRRKKYGVKRSPLF